MNKIGILQGRLTPSNGRGIQFFPFEEWREEFRLAREIGIDEIEFIFDLERYEENPLWSPEGVAEINDLQRKFGVEINSICADFFMRRPFFRTDKIIQHESIEILKKLIKISRGGKAGSVEIPILGNASLKTPAEQKTLIASLKKCLPIAEECNVMLAIESDLPPSDLLNLVQAFNHPLVKVVYDSGNSAMFGFDPYEEVITLKSYISNIHIKDGRLAGSTVALGTGDANFDRLFQGLKEINYAGSFILQAARGEENKETETIKNQKQFVERYITEYLK